LLNNSLVIKAELLTDVLIVEHSYETGGTNCNVEYAQLEVTASGEEGGCGPLRFSE